MDGQGGRSLGNRMGVESKSKSKSPSPLFPSLLAKRMIFFFLREVLAVIQEKKKKQRRSLRDFSEQARELHDLWFLSSLLRDSIDSPSQPPRSLLPSFPPNHSSFLLLLLSFSLSPSQGTPPFRSPKNGLAFFFRPLLSFWIFEPGRTTSPNRLPFPPRLFRSVPTSRTTPADQSFRRSARVRWRCRRGKVSSEFYVSLSRNEGARGGKGKEPNRRGKSVGSSRYSGWEYSRVRRDEM